MACRFRRNNGERKIKFPELASRGRQSPVERQAFECLTFHRGLTSLARQVDKSVSGVSCQGRIRPVKWRNSLSA
jgi:hypothetical protein